MLLTGPAAGNGPVVLHPVGSDGVKTQATGPPRAGAPDRRATVLIKGLTRWTARSYGARGGVVSPRSWRWRLAVAERVEDGGL